jgi:hypothetical protein
MKKEIQWSKRTNRIITLSFMGVMAVLLILQAASII